MRSNAGLTLAVTLVLLGAGACRWEIGSPESKEKRGAPPKPSASSNPSAARALIASSRASSRINGAATELATDAGVDLVQGED